MPPILIRNRSDRLSNIVMIPAREIPPAGRAELINRAYAGYFVPMHMTPDQMAAVDRFYDVDLARSLVAMSNGKPIGMALLSARGDRGWISGVGVLPEQRRCGVARAMIVRLIANAREAGLREIALEAISQNEPARRLYAQAGFRATRELLIWRRAGEVDALPIPEEQLTSAAAAALLPCFDRWHSEPPSWQRAAPTLRKLAEERRLKGYRLDWRGAPAAYCLVSGHGDTVALMDVGIDPATGTITPGRILLQALSHLYWGKAMIINNVPADDPLNRVLAALGWLVTVRQMEMSLELSVTVPAAHPPASPA